MAILSFIYLITSLDLRIPNHISLGKFSDGGGWKSLPFEKPFLHSSPHPSVCTSVHYPTLIFHLEMHKEFSDG